MQQVVLSEHAGKNASRSDFSQSSRVRGTSDVDIESEGEADTVAHGVSRGRSKTNSENETYITRYEWLPSQLYSAGEQAERLTGEIMNLALRECFVKVDNQRPIRTRTSDLPPSFRSNYFKRIMLPVVGKVLARSPYLLPTAEVDAQIAARVVLPPPVQKPAAQQPAADVSRPEPNAAVIVEAPDKYASDFWKARSPQTLKSPARSKQRPGRKPVGELPPGADRFRIIDGEGVDNGD